MIDVFIYYEIHWHQRRDQLAMLRKESLKRTKMYIVVSPWVIAFYGIMPSKSTNREITCRMCSISFLIPI